LSITSRFAVHFRSRFLLILVEYSMPRGLVLISILASVFLLSSISCSDPAQKAIMSAADSAQFVGKKDSIEVVNATETFRGDFKNQEVIFTHQNFQTYTLNIGGETMTGHLNTERGYGDDPDATVYVLNDDKPVIDRRYFARTPSGSVYMLDKDRYVMEDAWFDRVVAPDSKPPTAAKHPAKAKKTMPGRAVTNTVTPEKTFDRKPSDAAAAPAKLEPVKLAPIKVAPAKILSKKPAGKNPAVIKQRNKKVTAKKAVAKKAAANKPAAKKPAFRKQAQKKKYSKKPLRKKTVVKNAPQKKVAAPDTIKKVAAKKFSKSAKKKRPLRKTRKRARVSTAAGQPTAQPASGDRP
jgi:hypothetical protein